MSDLENLSNHPDQTASPEEDSTPHILVVDDSESLRTAIEENLTSQGYLVTTAKDGEEAWDMLKQGNSFDLIITDEQMGKMSGHTLITQIRQETPMQETPIIWISMIPEDTMEMVYSEIFQEKNVKFVEKNYHFAANLPDIIKSLLNAQEG